MEEYVLGIDQSTQGTKVLLFNHLGEPVVSVEKAHKQIVDQQGWVEHDPVEIINNIYACVHEVINKAQIDPMAIRTVGIANQRETVVAWDAATGKPVYNAIVWQCSRAKFITNQLDNDGKAEKIFEKTGLRLSPFFSAAKFEWIIQQVIEAKRCLASGTLRIGTMDSWVLHSLTDGKTFQTDLSNASRTQLLNISTLSWDSEICAWFGIPMNCLPELVASDNHFGFTSFGGILPKEIPIRAILGDSHSSMFAMGCISKGMMKATYGTGSSIMMNIGDTPLLSMNGLVTSVAWKIGDKVNYVLEGNVNYSAAVITWLKDSLHLIDDPRETAGLAEAANQEDTTFLVPAFSGLGAPYWDNEARASFVGMSRTTAKPELVKAALECIAYQNSDIIESMKRDTGISSIQIRADGGATKNDWLMQFQSDIQAADVLAADSSELSAFGVAWLAGISDGLYSSEVGNQLRFRKFAPAMKTELRENKLNGWQKAVKSVLINK